MGGHQRMSVWARAIWVTLMVDEHHEHSSPTIEPVNLKIGDWLYHIIVKQCGSFVQLIIWRVERVTQMVVQIEQMIQRLAGSKGREG